ncbi:2-hydroxychromene-2-carboxylate isomerase [Immundisolibacter sp.]|uniref:2-hydroxychromene-2-carboxylate isomerase n=2 Tax=Immundisolibacter sp. TaxID=1934948 RepID=UPI00356621C3
MPGKMLDFYIDFTSPFTYLCNLKLPDLVAKYGCQLNYHPIDIPTAKLAAGNYGPSNRQVPAKIRALMQDLNRWADHYGVPFKFPKGLNAWRMNIGTFYAIEKDRARQYVDEAYRLVWGEGVDPDDEGVLRGLAKTAGLDADEFMVFVSSRAGEKAYEASRVAAHARGVYGVPIMMLDDQIWWGNDRLMFVEEYLKAHAA